MQTQRKAIRAFLDIVFRAAGFSPRGFAGVHLGPTGGKPPHENGICSSVIGWTLVLAAAVSVLWAPPRADAEFTLKGEQCVVLYGDALIGQPTLGLNVESFIRVRYPQAPARFYCIANREDGSVAQAVTAFNEEVTPLKPTVLVLCFGREEVLPRRRPATLKEEDFARIKQEFDALLGLAQQTGARVFVLTPPLAEVEHNDLLKEASVDVGLAKVAELIREACKTHHATVIDWYEEMAKFRQAQIEAGETVEVTRDGASPNEVGVGLATNALLTAWGAEPLDVVLTLDWQQGKGTCTHGKVTVAPAQEGTMTVKLEGLPIPWPYWGVGTRNAATVPCDRFCNIRLVMPNAPARGITVAEPSKRALPILAQQLVDGFDLATIGPLVNAEATYNLRQAIIAPLRYYDVYRRQRQAEPPEPEYAEALKLFRQAALAQYEGAVKVLARTPRTMDLTLEITDVEVALKREKEAAQPASEAPPASTPAPVPDAPPAATPAKTPKG